jgi:hypothetical protein
LPFFRIREIHIIPVVDLIDEREQADLLDPRSFENPFDHPVAEIGVLDPAMHMGVDCREFFFLRTRDLLDYQ